MCKWLKSAVCMLVTITIIYLLLPFFMGFLAENKYRQVINVINSTTPLQVKITDYKRGWFGARAVAQIFFDQSQADNQAASSLVVYSRIKHGPVIFDQSPLRFAIAVIDAGIKFSDEMQEVLLKNNAKVDFVAAAKIICRLDGKTIFTFASLPWSYQDLEHNLQWQGGKIVAAFSPLFNQVQSVINFPGIDISTKDYMLHLEGINSYYKGKRITNQLWQGSRDLSIKSFFIKNNDTLIVALTGLNLNFLITDYNNVLNLAVKLTLDSLNLGSEAYNKNILELECNKFSKTAFLKTMQSNAKKSMNFGAYLSNVIRTMFSSGGEINVKRLDLTSTWGALLASAKVVFANQSDNSDYSTIFANSVVTADIKLERNLALHLAEKLYPKQQEQQKLVNNKEAAAPNSQEQQLNSIVTAASPEPYLHVNFEYKDNQFLFNGKPLNLTDKT